MPIATLTWAVAEVIDQNRTENTMIKKRIFHPLLEW
jgi:hypothetical protein